MKKSVIKESLNKLIQILLFDEDKTSCTGNPLLYLENTPTHAHIHSTYTIYFIPVSKSSS